jgi:hypothetical protein
MPAAVPLELSPEERSFFDAGDELDAASGGESAAPETGGPQPREQHGHYVRRRSRRRLSRRIRRKLRDGQWSKTLLSAILVIAAVWGGYKASMKVANQDVPDPAALGVEARPR